MKQQTYRMIIMGAVIGVLCVTIGNIWYRTRESTGLNMVQDIALLHDIFKRIHEHCTILGFDYQKNPINFLNVVQFTSSEVGPMNLAHPHAWQGPYREDNPHMQGLEYQIVRTKKGYFITPGQGVKLPNGNVIGRDILLDENADIEAMMGNEQQLQFRAEPLAAKITVLDSSVEKINNAVLQEYMQEEDV